jgi:hypothetical protein
VAILKCRDPVHTISRTMIECMYRMT